MPAIEDGIHEAQRCSNCFHDPCILSYPAQLNDHGAHNALSEGEVYLAAQCLLMPNALACMCGFLRPTPDTCQGSCVLNQELGSIHIPQLHRAILDVFFRPCIPALPPLTEELNLIPVTPGAEVHHHPRAHEGAGIFRSDR